MKTNEREAAQNRLEVNKEIQEPKFIPVDYKAYKKTPEEKVKLANLKLQWKKSH